MFIVWNRFTTQVAGVGVPMSQDANAQQELIHVHQCTVCGHLSVPERFSSRENVQGLFECPSCHFCGALNVQIVPRSELEQES